MNCKKCGNEIPEGTAVCPNCGNAAGEKNSKLLKIIMGAVGGLVIVAVLVGAILYGMGINFLPRENDIYYKDSYTKKDSVLEKNLNTVVATMGHLELTCGELQIYYWQSIFGFLEEYGSVLGSVGLDVSKPFDAQIFDKEKNMTFQQVFLQMAFESWSRYASITLLAEEAEYELSQEQKDYVASFRSTIENASKEAGYTDVEKFIDEMLFPGCSFETYLKYNEFGYSALAYYETLFDKMQPTEQEIIDYFAKNEATLTASGFGKDAGNYYDVRHILIPVEGQKDENGVVTYTDEDWENCRAKAQMILDKFLAGEYEGGTTEEVFADLAKNNSVDPGSKDNGGLYSELTKSTNFIEGFKNWYLEEGRMPGDTGLVKNTQSATQGYHIMYFSACRPIWEVEVANMIPAEKTSKLLEDAVARWPLIIDFKKVMLGHMDLT